MSGKVNLDRWGPHLRAAKQTGKTLRQYAAEHGVSRHTLYAARQMLKAGARGARSGAGAGSLPPFTEVKLVGQSSTLVPGAAAPSLRARLPNGVALELACEGADATLVRSVIDALMGRG